MQDQSNKSDQEKESDFILLDNSYLQNYSIVDTIEETINNNLLILNQLEVSPSINLKKKNIYKNVYCVNCGEKGHVVKECNGPITSFGILAFKIVKNHEEEIYDKNIRLANLINKYHTSNVLTNKTNTTNTTNTVVSEYPKIKFLMIQRKDTMGYIDFVRGKYPEDNEVIKKTLLNICLDEMTYQEKHNLLTKSFDTIWNDLWVNHESKCFKNEYELAKKKFLDLDIQTLVKNSNTYFEFQEFGFPKGRRNMRESNIACAEREFFEETGYDKSSYDFIKNYPIICEEFVGTNGVKYRHIYYLVKMKDDVLPPRIDNTNVIQTGEVQNIGWFSFDECMALIRPYDKAKKNMINRVYNDLQKMNHNFICSSFYYNNNKRHNPIPSTPFSHSRNTN
jgi:8-oxo-dGTP pyrophosphatase MutT (NUDIX family)